MKNTKVLNFCQVKTDLEAKVLSSHSPRNEWNKLHIFHPYAKTLCYLFNIYEGLVLLKLAYTVLILINTHPSNVNFLTKGQLFAP